MKNITAIFLLSMLYIVVQFFIYSLHDKDRPKKKKKEDEGLYDDLFMF